MMLNLRCYSCQMKDKPTRAILQSSTLVYDCANCGYQNKADVVNSTALLELIENRFIVLAIHDCEYLPDGPELTMNDYRAFKEWLTETDNIAIHAC